jgi:hypothetical protein
MPRQTPNLAIHATTDHEGEKREWMSRSGDVSGRPTRSRQFKPATRVLRKIYVGNGCSVQATEPWPGNGIMSGWYAMSGHQGHAGYWTAVTALELKDESAAT